MQYKCENNVIEQIDEISLTSNLGWIGYATISNRHIIATRSKRDWRSGFKTDNDRYNKLSFEVDVAVCLTQCDTAHAFSLSTRPPPPPPATPTPQKSLRIRENLMGAFLKVGGFELTQTHP